MRLKLLLIAVTLAGLGCGNSTETEDVVDFSGTWTLHLDFVADEDVRCIVDDLVATVTQDGTALSGATSGGTQECRQGDEIWPVAQIGTLSLSGAARPSTLLLSLSQGSDIALSLTGQITSGGFAGTLGGSMILDPFNLGEQAVQGAWDASR